MGAVNLDSFLQKLNGGGEAHDGTPRRGPRGGLIDNPTYHPEARNAPLSARIIETKDGEKIVGLHDSREQDSTRHGVQAEKPWHRMAAHMLNRGFTNIDVADAAGVDPGMVSILRAQRWFNELCATLAEDKEKVIRARLDGYALDAVEEIAKIAFNDAVNEKGEAIVPARVRLTAQTTLLEQAVGRPTQKVLSVSATTSFSSEREEYDAIMQELQKISPAIVGNSGAAGHDETKPLVDLTADKSSEGVQVPSAV